MTYRDLLAQLGLLSTKVEEPKPFKPFKVSLRAQLDVLYAQVAELRRRKTK